MAVRPSTQQTIDRIVGTVALLGLSLAALRWLSHPSKRRQKSLPWWWPVIALQRRRNKREGSLEGEVDQSDAREKNMERGFEHRGSCHCRSVQFMVSSLSFAVFVQWVLVLSSQIHCATAATSFITFR